MTSGSAVNNLSSKCARGYHKRGWEFKVLSCDDAAGNVMSIAALCNIVKDFKWVPGTEKKENTYFFLLRIHAVSGIGFCPRQINILSDPLNLL
jgi:hypothetical protein